MCIVELFTFNTLLWIDKKTLTKAMCKQTVGKRVNNKT